MNRDSVVSVLAASSVFAPLDPIELERLADASRVRRFDQGERIFTRGDLAGGMFLIAQGSVALSITSMDGDDVLLALLGPPRTFGELAVIDDGPRVATADARRPTVLVEISRAGVQRVLRLDPQLGVALLRELATLIRRIDEQATDLVLVDLPGRVAKFLLAAAGPAGPVLAGARVPVDVQLTQTEVARLVGGSRQQVNRAIVQLEAVGAVERSGSRIVAVRPDLLQEGARSAPVRPGPVS
jgi:CRP-like cAMP-binding protein